MLINLNYVFSAIYNENLTDGIASFEEVLDIFLAAHKYEIKSIEVICEKYLIKNLQKYDLNDVFEFAQKFLLKDLQHLCKMVS